MMKQRISRIVCAAFCCLPLLAPAQTSEKDTSPGELYREGEKLFRQKAYGALGVPLKAFLRTTEAEGRPLTDESKRAEAEYMLACADYELGRADRIGLLEQFLEQHPDTPHANRIYALMAFAHFFDERYDEALALFNAVDPALLADDEREDATYRLALCHLKTGNLKEAFVWFETTRTTGEKYLPDCTYYLSYIRYTRGQYDEALQGFLSLTDDAKYGRLAPCYAAECYLLKRDYDRAARLAQEFLDARPAEEGRGEMYRVLGSARYHQGRYNEAMKALEAYLEQGPGQADASPRRDALYMLGLSCYHCGVYGRVPDVLGRVVALDDALTQNAWLHIGLACLQTGDKTKARMAFEQASVSDADRQVKEQAAYNYALCVHETAYSAFGESVTVFERFLNDFPQSVYADRVSGYLVEVYLSTRSYAAALRSIERIGQPGRTILEAKQKILFQLGTESFANARFDEAAGYLDRSLELGQYDAATRAAALYWRGEAAYRMGRMSEAARYFNSYLATNPSRGDGMYALAHYNLGYIAFHEQDYDEAKSRFATCLAAGEAADALVRADACNRIGDCYLHVRRFDEARDYYTRAEALNTSAGDYACYQLALVAGLQKDYAGKVALLDRLAARYPGSAYAVSALYEKGRSYVQEGNSTQAVAAFRELLSRYPESPSARKAAAELGLLYYQNDDYDRAIEAYRYVVTRYPGSDEARLAMRDLKSIYVDANRVEEFAALAAQMPGQIRFEASEQDSLTYMAAERVYMKGDTLAARQSMDRYLQTFPDGAFSLNAHYYLALMARNRGDEDALLEHTGRLLEYADTPYSEEALLMRGEVLFRRKQYEEALADYRRLQLKASTPERRQLGTLGVMRCAVLTGNDALTTEAATTLLGEAKLSPELRDEALYYRGKTALRQGVAEQALGDLKQLAQDTRTMYGAEAKYLVAQYLYDTRQYAAAEREALDFIDRSTPHAYWLARCFVLLSDVYVALDKPLEARQYLLSLQQNYQADDDIATLIEERLQRLD